MKVLITGSHGFVGTEFRRWFAAHQPDAEVTCIDINAPLGSGVRQIDARTFFASDHRRYDLVIHLAAIVGGRATIDGNPMAVATDLAIDADLWQYALRTRPGQVVYYSSSAAYPTHLQMLDGEGFGTRRRLFEPMIDLANIRQPDQTYGLAKLVGEVQAAHVLAAGIPTLVLRPFSGYGPTQTIDYPTPAIVARAVRRENPLPIWSDAVRDFIHIDDVVAGTMAMVEQRVIGTVNLCTGRATSFSQLALMAGAAVGYQPEIAVRQGMPTGVSYRVGDPTEMLRYYQPTITLEQGIAGMVEALR